MIFMKFRFTEFTEDDAKEICTWQYEGEYRQYGCPEWSKAVEKKWGITIAEKREKEFKSVYDENNLMCGFVRFRSVDDEESVLIGLGLKPCLCGHGVGAVLMQLIKDYCDKVYHWKKIVLDVDTQNKRAIKCYERAGFKKVVIYDLNHNVVEYDDSIRMEYVK